MQGSTYFKAGQMIKLFFVYRTIRQSSVGETYIISYSSVLLVGTETKQTNSKGQFPQVPTPHTHYLLYQAQVSNSLGVSTLVWMDQHESFLMQTWDDSLFPWWGVQFATSILPTSRFSNYICLKPDSRRLHESALWRTECPPMRVLGNNAMGEGTKK